MSGWYDWLKNKGLKVVIEIGKTFSPPPEKDTFQINGEMSPDQFIRAGHHLTNVSNAWQWKASENKEFVSKYLPEKQQYLLLEKVLCRRRLNTNASLAEEPKPL